LEQWRRSGRTFEYRGREIFYHDQGHKDVVLCIHGFPTASYDWISLWHPLTCTHRAIAPDMIGFGFSAKPKRYDYSILDQADLHEALLAHLRLERCHVLAHDYGDTVAQELLARYLDRSRSGSRNARPQIDSICFLNGGLFPETHRARTIQRLLATPGLGFLLARLTDRRRFEQGFRAVFGPRTQPSDADMDDFWSQVSHDDGHHISHRLIGYMQERRRHRERWVGALQTGSVPLRLINGPADPVSGRHMAERYRELVPEADVVLLGADIGHYPQVEDPENVLVAYLSFLEQLAAHRPTQPPPI